MSGYACRRKRSLWFYRYRHTYRGQWFALLKDHDPEWEYVARGRF